MKMIRFMLLGAALMALIAGCSREAEVLSPQSLTDQYTHSVLKNGTETLGVPSIAIADGSGFVEGGVGMVGVPSGTLTIDVPMGATVNQALLYWSGGATSPTGDDTIIVDGTEIQGELIGGPVNFFSISGVFYYFNSYRADITDMNLVSAGANSFTISGFDFTSASDALDENNGASILVIYDDGTEADLSLVDGLDMAFFRFVPTLDATVPQTLTFGAEGADRNGDLVIMAGSVGEGRPNQIKVTTSAGDQMFTDVLGSFDALLWDSMILSVFIPAGDTSLTVEIISTPSVEPLGASLGWVGAGLSVPVTPPELACIGDYVWHDVNQDGIQDGDESGIEGVVVHLMDCAGNTLAEAITDEFGGYLFCELATGDYNIHFVLPAGYVFSPQGAGMDYTMDSDADVVTGMTACTTLDPGETDLSWDAGMYMPQVQEVGCRFTGGGNSHFDTDGGGIDVYTFGGQAGAPLASQPQPWGNWTHHNKKGDSGSFIFHAGTPSAPEGTEIDWITCMDPGWCKQARPAPAKQLDFAGVGTFKNMKKAPSSIADFVTVGESLHWFEVNIDDLGEPGGHDNPGGCDPLGFGRNGGAELADCDCPDFYRIRIYEGSTDASAVMYEVFGYIDNGNLQIHPPTGRDDISNW